MNATSPGAGARPDDQIDIGYDYAVCAWARHFTVSEKQVKEAVAAVGDRAGKVGEHLRNAAGACANRQERPSGH